MHRSSKALVCAVAMVLGLCLLPGAADAAVIDEGSLRSHPSPISGNADGPQSDPETIQYSVSLIASDTCNFEYAVTRGAGRVWMIGPDGRTVMEWTATVYSGTAYLRVRARAGGLYRLHIQAVPFASRNGMPVYQGCAYRLAYRIVHPAATVLTPIAPAVFYRGKARTVYGFVAPSHSTGTYLVTLKFYKRNSAGRYVYHHSVAAKRRAYTAAFSKYVASVALPHAGKWRVRAYHSCSRHSGSYSGYDYIIVR